MSLAVVPGPWYPGYVWAVTVRLRDPATCQPLTVAANWELWGDFYAAPGAPPQRIALTDPVPAQARGNLVVPAATTKNVAPDASSTTGYPVHAVLGYTDAAGDHALGPIYFRVSDPSAAGVSS